MRTPVRAFYAPFVLRPVPRAEFASVAQRFSEEVMETVINNILSAHEREDEATAASEEDFIRAVRREFANADDILAAAEAEGVTAADFVSGKAFLALHELPVRRTDGFYVKKHTAVQRPYPHSHEFYELIFVRSGKCVHTSGGQERTLNKGECCIVSPGAAHVIGKSGKGDVILKAVVPADMFERAAEGVPLTRDPVIYGRMSIFAEQLSDRLLAESESDGVAKDRAVSALLTLFLCELTRAGSREETAERIISEYLAQNYRSASLVGYARSCGYTPAYASRHIKQKTGKNFSELLRDRRMKEACGLLTFTDMSVEDVSAEVGYKSAAGFYKQFVAYCGMTPAEYRKTLS